MRDAVSSGYLPPWHADGPHGTFRNDRRRSDSEKPTSDVKWGDQTWEEMQFTGFFYSVTNGRPRPGTK